MLGKLKLFVRKALSFIQKALFFQACNGPLNNFAVWVLRVTNWQPVKFSKLDNRILDESVKLAESSTYLTEAPRWIGEASLIHEGKYPEILVHVLREGVVTAYSPAVLKGKKLYLPEHLLDTWPRILTDSAGLFLGAEKYLVGRINAQSKIDGGILIGGAGSFNWYHFVIECLPKAWLVKRLPAEYEKLPLIVPEECKRLPSFADALGIFAAGRRLHFLRRGECIRVDRLVVVDEVSVGPFNLVSGEWPRIEDYSQHEGIMRQFLSEFRSEVLGGYTKSSGKRKIYLSRPSVRRSYNQDELVEIAKKYDFVPVNPELLSLEEQARTFAEAAAVVGPSGAAWVGMIFSDRPFVGLSWLPVGYRQFCAYSALGGLLGHRIKFLEARTEQTLRSTGEAYTADYKVCPSEFEKALQEITMDPVFSSNVPNN